ncbi:MAG: ribosomal RNA small subunit methyltransferase I, partial [Flavitalea sp.]
LTAYHQHNEHQVVQHLVNQMSGGRKMALMSDAGTPAISDPGFLLVRECVKQGVRVECLPGPTAFVPALVNSGLPANRFTFEGFLPLKKGRQTMFKKLATEERTMIFYESPMRLVKTLADFIEYFGAERQCSVSRELSKIYEENIRGSLQEVHDHFNSKGVKGEIVIVVAGVE